MMIVAPHRTEAAKLQTVIDEMRRLGAPTLRGVRDGHSVLLIEGSHRLAACIALGLAPVIDEVDAAELVTIQHDGEFVAMTAGDAAALFGDDFDRSRNGATLLTI